jgi:hypothetical protein
VGYNLLLPQLQPSSAAFFFCSSAFRFTSATGFIIYCSKKSQVSVLDENSKKKGHELQL